MGDNRISKRSVDGLQCDSQKDRAFLWDDALSGFGAVAYPTGRKVYIAQFRQAGRSRRITIGEHGRLTAEEARSEAKKLLGAVETGADPIAQRRAAREVRSVREVAAEFLASHVAAKRKGGTQDDYERIMRLHVLPALGSRRMNEVRRSDVQRLHSSLSGTPAIANKSLAVISSAWNWAAKREEPGIGPNPATGIDRFKEVRRERFLSAEELARLGDAIREGETNGLAWATDETKPTAKHTPRNARTMLDPYAAAAIRLLILTGARLREVLHARWDWIDFDRGMIHLPDSKTGQKPIYLSAAAQAVLASLARVEGNPHVFPGEVKGEPRTDLKKPWAAITRAAGLEGLRIHDLRHSFASVGAGANLGLPVIGKLLGHSQPATTARYAHLDADPMRRAVETIGNSIAAAMGGKSATVVAPRFGKGGA